jgi:hypothetical protein
MKSIKQILTLIGLLFLFACKHQQIAANQAYLKEYAFCKCLSQVKDYNYASATKADISASVYLDISGYPIDVHILLDSAAAKAAALIKPSMVPDHQGKKAVLMGCFDFYKSKQLDSLIRKIDKERRMPDPWK